MNMTRQVVSYLTQKKDGTSPIYFAPELHFVKPLFTSGVNNLEEQLLLGVNKETEAWVDEDNVVREIIKFKNGDRERYYLLDRYIYNANSSSEDDEVYILENTLGFNRQPKPAEYEDDVFVDLIDSGYFTINENNDSLDINAPVKTREERLLFHTIEDDVDKYYLVASKTIIRTIKNINDIPKVVTEEKITSGNYQEVLL